MHPLLRLLCLAPLCAACGDPAETLPDTGAASVDTGLADSGSPDSGGDTAPDDDSGGTTTDQPVYILGTNRGFASIQDGIWGAEEGDTVVVRAGTYYENIDFKGKVLTLTSEDGPDATIIDGGGVSSTVEMRNWEPAETVLQGFTITNGEGTELHGGGIFVEWGSPTLRHNIFRENNARIGGGVYVRNGAARVHNNIMAFNNAEEGGGGFTCSACAGSFEYNTLYFNTALQGPACEIFWGSADLIGNMFVMGTVVGSAVRFMDPREDDPWVVEYNLLSNAEDWVLSGDSNDADAWPEDVATLITDDPGFVDGEGGDWALLSTSPAVDAGPPDATDPDGSRADMGAYGGPDGDWGW